MYNLWIWRRQGKKEILLLQSLETIQTWQLVLDLRKEVFFLTSFNVSRCTLHFNDGVFHLTLCYLTIVLIGENMS